jgi:hypothetical protein
MGSVSELTGDVLAPAPDPAAGEKSAGVELARRNLGSGRDPRHLDRGQGTGGRPVSELAEAVIAPALDLAAGEKGAVWESPVATWIALEIPVTSTGVELSSVVPSPSWREGEEKRDSV